MSLRPLRRPAPQADQISAGRQIGELFEQHARMVHALCRLILRDRLEAEDAAQQTFLSAYRSLLRGGNPDDPRAWLAAIARNECRARLGKRQVAVVPIDESEGGGNDVFSAVEQREEIEALATALSELPQAQRNAVVLREFYGLSYAEVGAVLGLSGPAVESLLFKGRRRLQGKLGSLRLAGVVALPDALRDGLAQALPGFAGASAVAGATKVIALPTAAKVATMAVLLTGGGVAVVETAHRDGSRPAAEAQADAAVEPRVSSTEVRPPMLDSLARAQARTRAGGRADESEHDDEREVDGRRERAAASGGRGPTFEREDDDERDDDTEDVEEAEPEDDDTEDEPEDSLDH